MATRTTKPRPAPTRTIERRYARIPSPIGELLVIRTDEGLCGLYVDGLHMCPPIDPAWVEDDEVFDEVRVQLDEYFAGKRDRFDLPLALEGTEFQRTVWQALLDIPFGETESYGELAERIGRPTAPRAVGMANGKNPVSIIVPCHRVIGANGSLTGYGWGTERKAWLLEHEGARPQPAAGAKR